VNAIGAASGDVTRILVVEDDPTGSAGSPPRWRRCRISSSSI
jgi:hypothetical protein